MLYLLCKTGPLAEKYENVSLQTLFTLFARLRCASKERYTLILVSPLFILFFIFIIFLHLIFIQHQLTQMPQLKMPDKQCS